MASRTMPAIFGITVCFFLVCIANTTTAQMTTGNHSETSEKSQVSTATPSAETTLSPTFNVTNMTLSNEKTTPLNVSELSQFSTSIAAPTTQSTVNVAGSSTLKAIATSSSNSSSTVPLTGHSTTSNNQTYSTKTSGVTRVVSTTLPTQTKPTPQYNGTETTANGTASTEMSDKNSMKYSEIILTSIFSAILVVVVLVILSFGFKKCLRGSFQYSHHPLRETSYEPADSYSPPDDTLVISGGLYDAPRIYNPNMTVLEEEESQTDYASFNSRSGHLRLEFLPGDKDMDPVFNGSQTRNV